MLASLDFFNAERFCRQQDLAQLVTLDIVEGWIIVAAKDKTFAPAQKTRVSPSGNWRCLRKLRPADRGTSVPWRKPSDGRESVLSALPSGSSFFALVEAHIKRDDASPNLARHFPFRTIRAPKRAQRTPTGHMGPSVQRLEQPRAEVSARHQRGEVDLVVGGVGALAFGGLDKLIENSKGESRISREDFSERHLPLLSVGTTDIRHNIARERQVKLMDALKFARLLRMLGLSREGGAISAFHALRSAPYAVLLRPAASNA